MEYGSTLRPPVSEGLLTQIDQRLALIKVNRSVLKVAGNGKFPPTDFFPDFLQLVISTHTRRSHCLSNMIGGIHR